MGILTTSTYSDFQLTTQRSTSATGLLIPTAGQAVASSLSFRAKTKKRGKKKQNKKTKGRFPVSFRGSGVANCGQDMRMGRPVADAYSVLYSG